MMISIGKKPFSLHDLYKLIQLLTVNSYTAGINFRRQIMTTKFDPRTLRVKIFIKTVDP